MLAMERLPLGQPFSKPSKSPKSSTAESPLAGDLSTPLSLQSPTLRSPHLPPTPNITTRPGSTSSPTPPPYKEWSTTPVYFAYGGQSAQVRPASTSSESRDQEPQDRTNGPPTPVSAGMNTTMSTEASTTPSAPGL